MSKALAEKKINGEFYSPDSATKLIANWAIKSKSDYILEPSFGGCSFLESSLDQFRRLGVTHPINHIFGCDCSSTAFEILAQKITPLEISNKFIFGDFLSTRPSDFYINKFDAVIGNPPYVSWHNLSKVQRETISKLKDDYTFDVKGNVSLWGWFVLHSVNFVKEGGKLGFILPYSLIHSYYGRQIEKFLSEKFSNLLIITLDERLFKNEGTNERSIFLLADGANVTPVAGMTTKEFCDTLPDVKTSIDSWDTVKQKRKPKLTYISDDLESIPHYSQLQISNEVKKLGDLVDIKIGLVTGANWFFVMNKSTADLNSIPVSSRRLIVANFKQVSGVALNKIDLRQSLSKDRKCILLNTCGMHSGRGNVWRYISSFPESIKNKNVTFTKRDIWHRISDLKEPDAFLSAMGHFGPRAALNNAKVDCINSLYRVYFKNDIPKYQKKLTLISMLTTFSQLSAEHEGRHYGSGVLKHEPSEAREISLYLPEGLSVVRTNRVFDEIDMLIRLERHDEARKKADDFIFGEYTKKHGNMFIGMLENSLGMMRARRHR